MKEAHEASRPQAAISSLSASRLRCASASAAAIAWPGLRLTERKRSVSPGSTPVAGSVVRSRASGPPARAAWSGQVAQETIRSMSPASAAPEPMRPGPHPGVLTHGS